ITLLHTITSMLITNQYVRLIALDFSKAFDSISHCPLSQKLAQLNIPDEIYNWILSFLEDHSHSTRYKETTSAPLSINASVIQGSALGPAAYIVTASDLRPLNAGNEIIKFADDTYLAIPASLESTVDDELMHIEQWSLQNNLKLNHSKSC